ncbi:hypothetical protein MBLNU230_g6778t1 [Neophaeotheca triangularis]
MFSYAPLLALAASSVSALPTVSTLAARQFDLPQPQELCGVPDDSVILYGKQYIVYNMMYNYQQIDGSVCTTYDGLTSTNTDPYAGEEKVKWTSVWDMAVSTDNIPKGYSFVGLTQGLETRLSDIDSIPATYHWIRRNETAYKGAVVFDFMTSDTRGDSTNPSQAQELMLWLRYEGGQLPIGYMDGPVAKVQLYGKRWEMYQGKNTDTGITVTSLVVDAQDQYWGWFKGDLKEWLMAVAQQGVFSDSTYVNVGNAGMEPFWGKVTFENKVAMVINPK